MHVVDTYANKSRKLDSQVLRLGERCRAVRSGQTCEVVLTLALVVPERCRIRHQLVRPYAPFSSTTRWNVQRVDRSIETAAAAVVIAIRTNPHLEYNIDVYFEFVSLFHFAHFETSVALVARGLRVVVFYRRLCSLVFRIRDYAGTMDASARTTSCTFWTQL
jgi:hypothetical protein